MGINFVLAPGFPVDKRVSIRFQNALLDRGIEYSVTQGEDTLAIIREASPRLEIKVGPVGPPAVGQLLIVTSDPSLSEGVFKREASAVVEAFNEAWPAAHRQVISCDATFRDLYESSTEHAFKELWESRLKQPADTLAAFGRPVLGGGLRFVMPPIAGDVPPVTIEVKIESFLRDTKQMFVETQFTWGEPMQPGATMNPEERLTRIDDYVENNVELFITGRTS